MILQYWLVVFLKFTNLTIYGLIDQTATFDFRVTILAKPDQI